MTGDPDLNVAFWLTKKGHPLSYFFELDPYEKLLIIGMIEADRELEGG